MSSRSLLTCSIDSDVLTLFRLRIPASQRSQLIENFMRDICQIQEPVVPLEVSQVQAMVEEARKKKHTAALELQNLEAQMLSLEKQQAEDQRKKEESLKVQFQQYEFEAAALQEQVKRLG